MSVAEETAPAAKPAQNGGETKRLTTAEVRHSDTVRERAEKQAGKRGPGRPKGSKTAPKAKTPEEAAQNAKNRNAEEKKAATREDDYREPSEADVRKFKRMLAVSNKPLAKMEEAILLKASVMGIMVDGKPLIERGDLQLSDEELDFNAECCAGTVALISPLIARWIPVVGLVVGSVGFCISRGIVISKCNAVFQKAEEMQAAALKPNDAAPESKP